MEEDKQLICSQLCLALQMTDNCKDLYSIRFSGGTKTVNVQMDSGTAMVRDIVNHLGV